MFKFVAALLAAAGFSVCTLPAVSSAADLVTTPVIEVPGTPAKAEAEQLALQEALSEYLNLLMIRATFDVVDKADLEARLADELRVWGGKAPDPAARADLDRQLLAEASYYIVSLSYTVQVGGAAFPDDKADMVYANDTIVELDDLQRQLADTVVAGGDTLPILVRVEEIRALTEGSALMADDTGVFKDHAAILDRVIETAAQGTRT